MALPEDERAAAIARIGEWYSEHARAGRIVEGRRLTGRGKASTVRLGRAGRSGKPFITDGRCRNEGSARQLRDHRGPRARQPSLSRPAGQAAEWSRSDR